MRDGKCSKGFPKAFRDETSFEEGKYPLYQRRNDGRTVRRGGIDLDNRWVVPYNPYLTRRYNAHINVEICASVKSFKYIYNYMYKGPDRATAELGQGPNMLDEVREYRDSRYVSAPEACWRIFGFKMHDRWPAVVRLQIHLPGQQSIQFHDDESLADVAERAEMQNTMLLAFFDRNRQTADEVARGMNVAVDSRQLLYQGFPSKFVWKKERG
jgi:hypothetical protein